MITKINNIIPSKQSPNDKTNIKTQINSSKSNHKDKNNNFYSITEINKNYKIPTKLCQDFNKHPFLL